MLNAIDKRSLESLSYSLGGYLKSYAIANEHEFLLTIKFLYPDGSFESIKIYPDTVTEMCDSLLWVRYTIAPFPRNRAIYGYNIKKIYTHASPPFGAWIPMNKENNVSLYIAK